MNNYLLMKIKIILIALLFSATANGQEKKPALRVPRVQTKMDQLILTLSSDNWKDLSSGFESKPLRSRGFSVMLMGEGMNENGTAGIGLGLGFSSQNVHTDAMLIENADGTTSLSKIPDSIDYDLNKLSLNFLDAALELRFRTKENSHLQRFKISLGIKAGLLLQSHTKYEDENGKFKTYGVANINKFQYGPTVRIGYASWGISGYYSMVTLLKKDKGPELIPFSIGISVTP
jgi:hypothetical protein